MKNFDRFAHSGVKPHLVRLLDSVRNKYPEVQVGSSGEGEVTLKRSHKTVYARKYKLEDGWRVVECVGAKVIQERKPLGEAECLEIVLKALG